ncbi:MAG: pyridoxal 5'-phosphate synthase, partial [Woeseiaceae bacterium]|nr:pyridoxal 5'-phosphate synthase [Woeseiaceae bacterium]
MNDDKHDPMTGGVEVADLRRPASGQTLERDDLADSPIQQFETWLRDACASEALDPNAMSVSTVGDDGRPSCRMVLLKYYDEKGFVFFTNYGSRKASQIKVNPEVALLFPWFSMGRQVSVTGSASRIS